MKRNIAEGDNNQQQEKKRRIASYPTQSTYAYNYGAYDNYSYGYSDPYSQSSMHPMYLSPLFILSSLTIELLSIMKVTEVFSLYKSTVSALSFAPFSNHT